MKPGIGMPKVVMVRPYAIYCDGIEVDQRRDHFLLMYLICNAKALKNHL